MKKKLVIYLAGLLTVLGLGFGQAQFSDVPAGHWAKEAVERIVACGLITGFPDGTFRGNANLTRYQAALTVQRLLTELQQGGECVGPRGGSLSGEDLAAIRNAVQELAAELAALGVRVSALEDNAASKDDIARLEAAIEELKAKRAEPAPSGIDEAALADLADRVEAASVAADTALAQAQVLAERLDAVEGDLATLKTQVEADADSIRALNELAVLLNRDVLSLQDRVTALEKQLGDVDFGSFANREDLSAIQEFSTALRSDLVRLSDRVSALDTRVGELDKRLATVEGTRPTLTGSLSVAYGYTTNTGGDFDIDRLFPGNALSSGSGADDISNNRIRNAFRRGDFNQTFTGGGANLSFGLKPSSGAISEVTLGIGAGLFNAGLGVGAIKLNSASVKGSLSGQAFTVTYDSEGSTFNFNPYLFNNSTRGLVTTRGFVATLDAKAFPLTPKFTIVAGEGSDNPAIPSQIYGINPTAYAGLRAELNLLGIATGLSYAEIRNNRSAFGVDYKGSLFGLLNLEGAFVASTPFGSPIDFSNQFVTDRAFYTKIGVKLGIVELNGNYRAIDPEYNNGLAGISPASGYYFFGVGGNGEAPYGPDNRGFGFDGKLTLPILGGIEVRGLYDTSADFATGSQTADTLSVGATIPLFAGFSLNPFYNNTNKNGAQVSGVDGSQSQSGSSGYNYNYNFYVYNNQDARWSSGFGVKLVHNGRASNALISGLDINLWYQSFAGPDAGTDILASAGYDGKLGFLSINPIIRFHSFTKAPSNSSSNDLSTNALKFGIGASTDPLGIFLKPSLEGAFVSQSITDISSGSNSSEQYWRVGLNLNEFLTSGSVFKVGYAQYTATNVSSPNPVNNTPARGFGNFPLSLATDRVFNYPGEVQFPWNLTTGFGADSGSVTGLYLEWKYGNLTMAGASAILADNTNTTVSAGTGFKISYEAKF